MKRTLLVLVLTVVVLIAYKSNAIAQSPRLKVGDPAPNFLPGGWAQGKPILSLQSDSVYILGFFATWSTPSFPALHHLNSFHLKYHTQNLNVIGLSVWEKNTQDLPPFLQSQDSKLVYPIALDDTSKNPKGIMAESWLQAAGRTVVPSAFVIDKTGNIAWIGHPLELPETVIVRILDGTFNLHEAAAAYQTELRAAEKMKQLWTSFDAAKQRQDWPAADTFLQEISQLTPPNRHHQINLIRIKFYLDRKDPTAATRLAQEMTEANPDHAMLLNEIAWLIASVRSPDPSTLDLAETTALRANTVALGKSPGILDTIARIQFLRGHKAKAISTQTRAVELASGKQKEHLQQVLSSYQAGSLPPSQQPF